MVVVVVVGYWSWHIAGSGGGDSFVRGGSYTSFSTVDRGGDGGGGGGCGGSGGWFWLWKWSWTGSRVLVVWYWWWRWW